MIRSPRQEPFAQTVQAAQSTSCKTSRAPENFPKSVQPGKHIMFVLFCVPPPAQDCLCDKMFCCCSNPLSSLPLGN